MRGSFRRAEVFERSRPITLLCVGFAVALSSPVAAVRAAPLDAVPLLQETGRQQEESEEETGLRAIAIKMGQEGLEAPRLPLDRHYRMPRSRFWVSTMAATSASSCLAS